MTIASKLPTHEAKWMIEHKNMSYYLLTPHTNTHWFYTYHDLARLFSIPYFTFVITIYNCFMMFTLWITRKIMIIWHNSIERFIILRSLAYTLFATSENFNEHIYKIYIFARQMDENCRWKIIHLFAVTGRPESSPAKWLIMYFHLEPPRGNNNTRGVERVHVCTVNNFPYRPRHANENCVKISSSPQSRTHKQ
jgi:hypothetical protein